MGIKRKDDRPICKCSAYKFPHRIGGKCDGSAFAEFIFYSGNRMCKECNCRNKDECDVVNGAESISEAECYIDRQHRYPGEILPLAFSDCY